MSLKNAFVVAMGIFLGATLMASPLVGDDETGESKSKAETIRLETLQKLADLQQILIQSQSKNFELFKLITQPFEAGSTCYRTGEECIAKKSDTMLLNSQDVVVSVQCVKGKDEELSDSCRLYDSRWLLKTQVRIVSHKFTDAVK